MKTISDYDFFEAFYDQLLSFTELNAEQLSEEDYFILFDKFLNQVYESDPLVQKYYVIMKCLNIYTSPESPVFDIEFVNFAADLHQAEEVIAQLRSKKGKQIVSFYLMGYQKKWNDRTKESYQSNLFLQKFSGQKVTSDIFPHAKMSFNQVTTVSERVRNKNFSQITVVIPKFVKGQAEKMKSPEKSPHKILIDKPVEDHDHKDQIDNSEQLSPALRKSSDTLAIEPVNTIKEEMIEDKIKEEKIIQQVNNILTPSEKDKADLSFDKPEKEIILDELAGEITQQERNLLMQENLLEILQSTSELIDSEGNVTKFVYAKMVPHSTDCFNTIYDSR